MDIVGLNKKRAFTRKAFYFKTEINRMNHEKEKIV